MTGTRWAESIKRRDNQGLVTIFNQGSASAVADKFNAEYKRTNRHGLIMNTDNDPARRTVEQCYRTNKTLVNPIIDWSDDDVWEFIHTYNLHYCSLYDEGWKRIGCIGCPLASNKYRVEQFKRWPGIYRMYIRAFDEMLKTREAVGKETTWKTGEEVMNAWISDLPTYKPIQDQIRLDDGTNELF